VVRIVYSLTHIEEGGSGPAQKITPDEPGESGVIFWADPEPPSSMCVDIYFAKYGPELFII